MNKILQLVYEINKLSRQERFELIEIILKDIKEQDRIFKAAYPIVKAHWIINCDGYYLQCSHCMEENSLKEDICPHCGAVMEEDK